MPPEEEGLHPIPVSASSTHINCRSLMRPRYSRNGRFLRHAETAGHPLTEPNPLCSEIPSDR
jgi:hypothetical protein